MFGKQDLVEQLSRDLHRAREKRDALTSDVTTLATQIAELETRLSEEKERRGRERALDEIEAIKTGLEDTATAFAPTIARLCDAIGTAAAVVPEARELNSFLIAVASEVDAAVDHLMRELLQRAEAVRGGRTEPNPPQPVQGAPEPKISDRLLLLPWPPRLDEAGKKAPVADRRSTAA